MSEILHIFHQPPPSHHQMHSHLQRDLINVVESQLVNCSFESDFGRFEETDLTFQCSDQFDGTGVFNCLSGSSVDELSKVTAVTEKNHTTRKRKPEIVDCDSGLIGPPKARKTALNGNSKPKTEQKPDYVHVRARRGQATDSHSLAERARRDRIKRKMQVLQDLVPGCNKITSKAAILDEIITYVQSLQRDVEFLTMKLAASASCVDVNVDNLFPAEQ